MQLPSLGRVISAVAILATTTALLATPTAANSQSAKTLQASERLAATSLSIRITKSRIEPGQTARITGHLALVGDTSSAGRMVVLEAKPLGSTTFVPVAEVLTAARGGLSTQIEPAVSTRYRWHFLGDTDARPSRSGVAALRVGAKSQLPHRLRTSLSIRKVYRVSAAGGIDIVRGRLRAHRLGLPHRPVILLSRATGATEWAYEGSRNTRREGVVKFRVDPSVKTAYRMVFLGTKRLRAARSGVVRVPHRADIAIAATPESITGGASVSIVGVVTDNGLALAGATVVLRATKVGNGPARKVLDRRVVDRGTTDADGSVTFTHLPKRSTSYRLRVVRGEGYASAPSAAVLVVVTPTAQ